MEFKYLNGWTQFPFGLVIAQNITEAALAKMLEERMESDKTNRFRFLRGLRMIGMKESERTTDIGRRNGFLVTFEDGKTVWCHYLVAADGSKSLVSNSEGISKLYD